MDLKLPQKDVLHYQIMMFVVIHYMSSRIENQWENFCHNIFRGINHCPAELFQSIFHSFKAGIANAISSFKWRKKILFMKNKHLPNWNICLAEHLPLNILSISVAFYLGWNFLENVYIQVQQDKG